MLSSDLTLLQPSSKSNSTRLRVLMFKIHRFSVSRAWENSFSAAPYGGILPYYEMSSKPVLRLKVQRKIDPGQKDDVGSDVHVAQPCKSFVCEKWFSIQISHWCTLFNVGTLQKVLTRCVNLQPTASLPKSHSCLHMNSTLRCLQWLKM